MHLDFTYHVIDLSRLELAHALYRPVARLTLHLMQFARATGTPFAVAVQADLWLAVPKPFHSQFWHYLFSLRHLDKETMKAEILSMQNETLREEGLSFAEYLLAEGKTEGIAKGIAKGIAEGEAKGRLHQARSAVLTCTEARFGEVPHRLRDHVASEASLERLELAIIAASRAESLAALLRALDLAR
jgi:hypothetical protein